MNGQQVSGSGGAAIRLLYARAGTRVRQTGFRNSAVGDGAA